MHPSALIRNKYVNPLPQQRLDGIKVIRQEEKTISRRNQLDVIFHHPDFGDDELYYVKRWIVVTEEGPPEGFFVPLHNEDNNPQEVVEVQLPSQEFLAMGERSLAGGLSSNDIEEARLLLGNINIDDDNNPAPENIPDGTNESIFTTWGHDGICNRKKWI